MQGPPHLRILFVRACRCAFFEQNGFNAAERRCQLLATLRPPQGFVEAKMLAKKFASLYFLLEDLLSPAKHYDWCGWGCACLSGRGEARHWLKGRLLPPAPSTGSKRA